MDELNLPYIPPNEEKEPIALDTPIGVKFSKNICLAESFLKQFNIKYEEKDLEDTPLGRGVIIKRD